MSQKKKKKTEGKKDFDSVSKRKQNCKAEVVLDF